MIERWSTFNENSDVPKFDSKFVKSKLSDKLMEVREVFIDFEDMGIVSYTVVVSGKTVAILVLIQKEETLKGF